MTLLEFIKFLFNTESLNNPKVQKDISQKEKASYTDEEEEEVVAMEVADEEEEFFM